MSKVTDFYAELNFKVNQTQLRQMDNIIKQIEARMKKFKSNWEQSISLSNFKFDSLKLQKSAQQSINKIQRMLVVDLSNFRVDESRLTRSLQSAIRRAEYSAGSLKLKAIVERSPLSQAARHYAQAAAGETPSGGGAILAGVPRWLAPAALGYGAYRATTGLFNQNATQISNRNLIDNVLGDPERGAKARGYYWQQANRLGIRASDNVQGYAATIAGASASGLSYAQGQAAWRQLTEHSVVNHLSNERQKGLTTAVVQMLSKGKIMSEELFGQAAEHSPTFPALVAQANAEITKSGKTDAAAMQALRADMKAGRVGNEVLLRSLQIASRLAQPGLERSSHTSQAELNRVINTRDRAIDEAGQAGLEQGFQRALNAVNTFAQDITPAATNLVKSFGEAYGAVGDFSLWVRSIAKGYTSPEKALETLKDKAPGVASSYWENHPGLQGIQWLFNNDPRLKFAKDSAQNIYDWVRGPEYGTTPGYRQVPDFQPYKPSELLNQLQGNGGSTNNQTMLQIAPGAFSIEINAPGSDATSIAGELERQMQDITDRVLVNRLTDARFQYPSIGR
ncbi:hypothetical protein HBN99_11385 [Pseudomonas oryzihabitans]|uniref:tape measure protein n=1 Tax=Pseudomonas oryzihabitans TaxID=47885 RepID=UPI001472E3B7|nr:tape measure protein [Pseudomonas oryzihabitans]NMZ64915.1 hypothetical protein [Pseudomonas oryzihabitans]